MYDVCGEKELKVILGLDGGDSISGVARKIDENRETIRRVVDRLEDAGYVAYDDDLHLADHSIRDAGLESAIQVVLEPRSRIETELVDGRPVIPLQETVAFATEHYATFESALEMLDRMYDDVDTYRARRQ